MPLLAYALTALALLALVHWRVTRLSRLAALALFLVPFVFTGKALLTGGVYAPVDHPWQTVPLSWMRDAYGVGEIHNGALSDIYMQMIPWRKAVQHSLAHGEWPLWSPFTFSGEVLAAASQSAPYHPLTLLALLLPVALSFTFTTAMTHFLAALGAFLFARELALREGASMVAATGFAFATNMALFALWPLGLAWAWLPWCLLGARRASLPLLTVAFTLLLLTGHPESALHVVTVSAIYWLVMVRRRTIAVVAAGLLALALSAIHLLPMFEAIPQTMEDAYRESEGFHALDPAVPPRDLIARIGTDLFPYLYFRKIDGTGLIPYDSAAVGSIVLALALFAAIRVRSRETWFFTGLAIFGLLARGGFAPIVRPLQELPLFDIALNERFSFAAAFALAMLAAIALDREPRAKGFVAMLIVIAAMNVYLPRAAFVDHAPLQWGAFKPHAEIAGLALAAILLAWRPKHLAWAMVALIALQRGVEEGGIIRTFDAKIAYPPIPILEPLKNVREPFRITGHGNAFIPGTSTLYGLEDVRGYQAMTFLRYRQTYPLWSIHQPVWYNRVDDLNTPFLDFLNVRYAITWDRGVDARGWREIARQKGAVLLENTEVLPRAFVPRNVRLGSKNALAEMAQQSDFAERAWIEAGGPADAANGPGIVTVRQRVREYDIDAHMQRAGWIVTSIPAWKGWRAYIDGKRVETQIANHAFVAVHVEEGRHRVRLSYWPRSFVIGRGITLATFVAQLLSYSALQLFRKRRTPPEQLSR